MSQPPKEAAEPIAIARRFAALSGPFEPQALRAVIGTASPAVALAVASDLADSCDTAQADGRWLMRGTARRREINDLVTAGALAEAVEWRRSLTVDPSTADLLEALTGSGDYAAPAMEATIPNADGQSLKRIATALDRAGPAAPAHHSADRVRSALGRVEADERSGAMLRDGFFGRTASLAKIGRWLERPHDAPPLQALFISGLPGIGKSTLIDEAVRRASAATPPWIVVRLDFDRSGLDVQDRVGLTMEITRQVSIALGEAAPELRQARLAAAGGSTSADPDLKGERREHVPDELARVLSTAVTAAGRPLLFVLDTLEVLRGRGETHPQRLFECLDDLCGRGLRPIAILAAGRGDALDSAKSRRRWTITLTGLDRASAEAMLDRLGVPQAVHPDILEIAEGNPLVIRLAAQVVREAGTEALDSVRRRKDVRAAFLYRVLLSRVGDPTLQQLAEPGLVVRRINPDVIAEVLAPQLLRRRLDPKVAVQVFDSLATNHWLVEPEPMAPGWVRHRSDIRGVLIRLLYDGERAGAAARIDRAAAKWFGHRKEPFAPIEAAYHGLQATRRGGDMPIVDAEVLKQLDAETIEELPVPAQDYVRLARGERTTQFRTSAARPTEAPPPVDLATARQELGALLERGDIIEAGFVDDRAFRGRSLDPATQTADVVRTFLWRAGRWREAQRQLGGQRLPVGPDDGLRDESPIVALARLEMAAELDFVGAVKAFREAAWLRSYAVDLRMRGIKGALGDGALAFALIETGEEGSKASWSLFDPAQASVTLWKADGIAPPPDDLLAVPLNQFAGRIAPSPAIDPKQPAAAARLLAGMTPYASVAEAVRSLGTGRILEHLAGADFAIAEAGGLAPTGSGSWSIAPAVSPEGSVDSLARLGLLAEWLGAAAFVLRDPDLGLIAQSAERWRRSTAGDWAYAISREGEGPRWSRRPDATIEDRVQQLRDAREPERAARDQLQLWWAGEPDVDVPALIERRVPATIRAARAAIREGDVDGAAVRAAIALQDRGLPAAFIPGIAVLTVLGELEGDRVR